MGTAGGSEVPTVASKGRTPTWHQQGLEQLHYSHDWVLRVPQGKG